MAGADHGDPQLALARRSNRRTVPGGALAPHSRIGLAEGRGVEDSDGRSALANQGDAHRPLRQTLQVLDRTVDGVDAPELTGRQVHLELVHPGRTGPQALECGAQPAPGRGVDTVELVPELRPRPP